MPGYVTCSCEHCDGNIEFDASDFGEGETRTVECPHCQTETMISVPTSPTPPPILPSPAQTKTVKGTMLDFTVQTNTGIISGDDGKRYSFQGAEWKEAGKFPTKGLRVDFVPQGGNAFAVYDVSGVEGSAPPTTFGQRPLPYRGYYRSSDEQTIGGVCGGLAHKMGVRAWLYGWRVGGPAEEMRRI